MDDNTIKFTVPADNSDEMKRILTEVYRSLTEKGGFLVSPPTFRIGFSGRHSQCYFQILPVLVGGQTPTFGTKRASFFPGIEVPIFLVICSEIDIEEMRANLNRIVSPE